MANIINKNAKPDWKKGDTVCYWEDYTKEIRKGVILNIETQPDAAFAHIYVPIGDELIDKILSAPFTDQDKPHTEHVDVMDFKELFATEAEVREAISEYNN